MKLVFKKPTWRTIQTICKPIHKKFILHPIQSVYKPFSVMHFYKIVQPANISWFWGKHTEIFCGQLAVSEQNPFACVKEEMINSNSWVFQWIFINIWLFCFPFLNWLALAFFELGLGEARNSDNREVLPIVANIEDLGFFVMRTVGTGSAH